VETAGVSGLQRILLSDRRHDAFSDADRRQAGP
jgi:hypothetical protein